MLGHFGSTKINSTIKTYFHWSNMFRTIKQTLKTCEICQKTKYANKHLKGSISAIITSKPGELVCVDFYGPLPSSRGNTSYIFVAVDSFSKYVKLYALRAATAKAAVLKIINDFHNFIPIKVILSDHGSQFPSKIWTSQLQAVGIKPTYSSIRHPASNPSERVMKELGRLFPTYCNSNNSAWALHLSNIENLFNTLPHHSTGFSPYEVIFNKKPPLPLDHIIHTHIPSTTTTRSIDDLHSQVYNNLYKHAKIRTKAKTKNDILYIGDWVLLRVPSISVASKKLYSKFQLLYEGPFTIIGNPYPNVYKLQDPKTKVIKGNYNVTNLKLYFQYCNIPSKTVK